MPCTVSVLEVNACSTFDLTVIGANTSSLSLRGELPPLRLHISAGFFDSEVGDIVGFF